MCSIFSSKELCKSNHRYYSFNELEHIEKPEKIEEDKNFTNTSIFETDIYITYPDKKFKKKISVNAIEYDKKNNFISYISKPILREGFFESWTEKKKFEHIDYERKNTVEEELEPLFLYEFIKLEKIDDFSTYYTLIEIFPSIGLYNDKYNIIKKHEGRKSRIKTNLENSITITYEDIEKDDPLGKLLYKAIKDNE
jgi:hypothetical protein